MSLENAITAHAAALSELAAAIRAISGGGVPMLPMLDTPITRGSTQAEAAADETATKSRSGVAPDADLDKAVGRVESDAKAKAAADKKAKADAKAKKDAADAAASAAASQTAGADSSDDLDGDDGLGDDAPTLTYKDDVRPVLLEAMRRTDKPTVQTLIKSYGVAKGEDIPPEHFADAIAKATALGV
jgi:hypothetical protein